ncbi:MAG: carbon-nitrogen hydrolase [Prevotella sp.]|nr:carbon-nitrogen hydrolase [Prevotella sp.]
MKQLHVGIIQQSASADKADNRRRLAEKIRNLARQGAQLIVLQELHDTPYFCQTEDTANFDLAETIPGAATDFYCALAKECGAVLVVSLFEKCAPGLCFNTAVAIDSDGTIAGKYRKMHIPDDPAYYEKFYFAPGNIGFRPIDTSLGRLGVMVCWDQWFPEAARLMALAGAEILIYPTAIGYASSDDLEEQQRQKTAWQTVQRAHAIANGLPVVTVNRTGFERDPSGATDGIRFWGGSFVAGQQGEILFEAAENEDVTKIITVDLNRTEQVRRWWPFLRDRRTDAYAGILRRSNDEPENPNEPCKK